MEFSQYFPIWNKLNREQQQRLSDVTELQQIKRGTVIHDGSPECKGMVLVKSGQLRAYLLSEEGREITICRFFEMDICLFSASCVMPNMMFDVFIEAEKDTEIFVIPACLYQNLMDESLPLSTYSRDLITNHFSEVMWLMEQIMWRSFDKRLAGFLVEEARIEETDSLKITHEKIAAHMGTAREVVTRMLRWFQSEGMVRLTRGTVELTDKKALQKLAES
ncbi:MAG: Crp/Fnr family transcriptional regulator [Oscillospiraceae bacterium]|nr:Crp/Fnr family transcriptional regulator [Oscillospiraceae bacterium]